MSEKKGEPLISALFWHATHAPLAAPDAGKRDQRRMALNKRKERRGRCLIGRVCKSAPRPVHRALVLHPRPRSRFLFFIRNHNKAARVDGLRGCRASSFINDYARRVARSARSCCTRGALSPLRAPIVRRYTYRTPSDRFQQALFRVAFFLSLSLSRSEIEQDRSARSLMSSLSLWRARSSFFCFVFCRAIQ